jgi:hypothetical protein
MQFELLQSNNTGLGLMASNNSPEDPMVFPLFETHFVVVSKFKFLLHASYAALPLLH